jgi:polyhydroxyalkanoate synthesis regulator phasin
VAEPEDTRAPGRAEAVRNAAVQAFQSTASEAGLTRERAQELADDLASAAGRVIGALDDLRPATAEDMRSLRDEVRALERRVAALEAAGAQPGPKTKAPEPPKPKP